MSVNFAHERERERDDWTRGFVALTLDRLLPRVGGCIKDIADSTDMGLWLIPKRRIHADNGTQCKKSMT